MPAYSGTGSSSKSIRGPGPVKHTGRKARRGLRTAVTVTPKGRVKAPKGAAPSTVKAAHRAKRFRKRISPSGSLRPKPLPVLRRTSRATGRRAVRPARGASRSGFARTNAFQVKARTVSSPSPTEERQLKLALPHESLGEVALDAASFLPLPAVGALTKGIDAIKTARLARTTEDVGRAIDKLKSAEHTAADAERVAKRAQGESKALRDLRAKQAKHEANVNANVARIEKATKELPKHRKIVRRYGPGTTARAKTRIKAIPGRVATSARRTAQTVRHPTTPLAHTRRFGTIAVPGGAKAGALAASGVAASEPVVTSFLVGGKREVTGTIKAPGKTFTTTVRVAVGMPAALVGLGADVVEAARHGNLDPIKGQIKQQERYWKQYSKLIAGTDAQAEKIVQEKLGLIPAATTGLTASALIKTASRLRVTPSEKATLDRATKRALDTAKHGATRAERRDAALNLEEGKFKEPFLKRHARRKREAERADVRKHKVQAHFHREIKHGGRRRVELLGRRETHVELLGRLSREQVTRDVSKGDVVPYLARHGYTHKTRDVLGKIRRNLESHVESHKQPSPDTVHTRQVEQALLDHPELLRDPDIMRAVKNERRITHGRAIERHELRTGKRQKGMDWRDERATYAPIQQAEGIRPLHERPGYEPYVAKRARRAVALERQAAREEARGNPDLAGELRHQAARLRRKAEKAQRYLHNKVMAETRAVMKAEGIEEPAYARQVDVSEARSATVPQQFPGAKTPRKERFRSGSLEARGHVDESVQTHAENLYRDRVVLAEHQAAQGFLDEAPLRFELGGGKTRIVTSAESRALRREGKVPRGYIDIPAQEFAGVIQRNDALRRELELSRYRADVNRHRGGEQRKLYFVVPEASIKEFRAQREAINKFSHAAQVAGRVQSMLMLDTNPTWAAFQLPAIVFGIVSHHWSPARYGRVARAFADLYRRAPERPRADFEAELGSNSGNLVEIGDPRHALTPATVRSMDRGLRFAFRTPAGRMLYEIGQLLGKGGPLGIGIRRYEHYWRVFGALMEADKMTGLTFKGNPTTLTRIKLFVDNLARNINLISEHQRLALERARGLKPHQRIEVYLDHSPLLRQITDATNDMLGSWGALTHAERSAAPLAMFYAFMRYSLRWVLRSFPKNHPLKMAILANLAQSNDVELQRILGGTPSFFQTFGTVITHTGEGGRPKTGLSLARSAPGSNAVIEAIGTGKLDLSTVVRPTQPIIGGTLLALAGKNPFGEVPAEGTSAGDLFLRNLASLSPLTRPLASKIGPPPSDFSKLYRAILGQPTGLKGTLVPKVTVDLRRQRTAQHLSELLDTAFNAPSWDDVQKAPVGSKSKVHAAWKAGQRAWDEINALMRAYGVQTAAEQHAKMVQSRHRRKVAQARYGIFGTGKQKSSGSSSGGATVGDVLGLGAPRVKPKSTTPRTVGDVLAGR